jgi:hypothetical protein
VVPCRCRCNCRRLLLHLQRCLNTSSQPVESLLEPPTGLHCRGRVVGALVYRGGFAQEQGRFRWYRGPVMMMGVSRHERGQMAMDQMAGG